VSTLALIALLVTTSLWLAVGAAPAFRRTLRSDAKGSYMIDGWGSLAGSILWALGVALLCAPLGPLPIMVRAWAERTSRDPRDVALLLAGADRETKLRRREEAVLKRERRIEELERELGIGRTGTAAS
jgi:hypothetical protein